MTTASTPTPARARAWVLASRPATLPAAAVPVLFCEVNVRPRNRQSSDGNPLAVVFDAQGLDSERMQALARWTNLAEKVKRNRTVFAQRRIKPEEVLPEWERMRDLLAKLTGDGEKVRAALPLHRATTGEPQICLVDESCRLQGFAMSFATHQRAGDTPQLVVYQRHERRLDVPISAGQLAQ